MGRNGQSVPLHAAVIDPYRFSVMYIAYIWAVRIWDLVINVNSGHCFVLDDGMRINRHE